MVDLNNLLENKSKTDKNSLSLQQDMNNKNITNDKMDRPTIKSPEYEQLKIKRKSWVSSKRASQIQQDIDSK